MAESLVRNLRRLDRENKQLKKAYAELLAGVGDETEGILYWENFVCSFRLSANLIIRVGKSVSEERRAIAWKKSNQLNRNEILKYLVESRNSAQHKEDERKDFFPTGKFQGTTEFFDGAIGSNGEVGSLLISNSQIGGRSILAGACKTDPIDGELMLYGDLDPPKRDGVFTPGVLLSAKGEKIPVPKNSSGSDMSAMELAEHGMHWLENSFRDLDLQSEDLDDS